MAKTPPTSDLRALATARLRQLHEPNAEQIAAEIAEAEAQGNRLIVLPGLRILIQRIADEEEPNGETDPAQTE
jgi:predicted amidohydrolase